MIPWTRRIQSKQAVGETWDTTQPTELPSSSGTGGIQVHKEFLLNRTNLGLETGGLVESTLEKDWRVLEPFHMAGQLPRPPWLKTRFILWVRTGLARQRRRRRIWTEDAWHNLQQGSVQKRNMKWNFDTVSAEIPGPLPHLLPRALRARLAFPSKELERFFLGVSDQPKTENLNRYDYWDLPSKTIPLRWDPA